MIILNGPQEAWKNKNDTSFDAKPHCDPETSNHRTILQAVVNGHNEIKDHDFIIVHRGVVTSHFFTR